MVLTATGTDPAWAVAASGGGGGGSRGALAEVVVGSGGEATNRRFTDIPATARHLLVVFRCAINLRGPRQRHAHHARAMATLAPTMTSAGLVCQHGHGRIGAWRGDGGNPGDAAGHGRISAANQFSPGADSTSTITVHVK